MDGQPNCIILVVWEQFVNNRVQNIKQLFTESVWDAAHIQQSCQPSHKRNNRNPAYFFTPLETWSNVANVRTAITTAEINDGRSTTSSRKAETTNTQDQPGIHHLMQVFNYSSLNRLLRITVYVLRFITVLMKTGSSTGPITAQELAHAEKRWIHNCQHLVYHEEIKNIQSKSSQRTPLVRQLRLYLDHDHLLRCAGEYINHLSIHQPNSPISYHRIILSQH